MAESTPSPELSIDIAALLETEVDLLPLMPELLADLEALGGSPELTLELLERVSPAPAWRVLDLGCGKGALALAVAARFGCRVEGVDGFAPFVDEANTTARKRGLADRCRFRQGNVRHLVQTEDRYDALIFAGLGDLLGPPTETVTQLRRLLRPGGFMVIGDVFLKPGAPLAEGYGYALHEDAMLRALTASGDRCVATSTLTDAQMIATNRDNNDRIRRCARNLMDRHPDRAETIAAYVRRQEVECRKLETCFVDAAWLIERVETPANQACRNEGKSPN
ncbi:Class I SAM-dependent methyltransferase [Sulfidibacter corallicola]|uniref:Class I SAM-dependent methyltransferase n=1 Tax=Sulfidibacter corallicola TaxID=2818388 RepID=A0A8A4TVX0_SULCO|nr:methyltransferase domain-containing protein [Sulfidibacter corallicola]QTD53318.1 class I SAM-dependent methyltransferase [Sulfidibacter corallicola]